MIKQRIFNAVVVCSFIGWASGCMTLPTEEELLRQEQGLYEDMGQDEDQGLTVLPEVATVGIYHKVNKSETLWRIASTYGVAINDIIEANNIPDAAQLEVNQLVFIPEAHSVREVQIFDDRNDDEFVWPVEGRIIHYFHQEVNGRLNKGINILSKAGTPVKASRRGRVVFADRLGHYGPTVILDHEDGYHSLYAYNEEILVALGSQIFKNQEIAKIGIYNAEPILHFEIRRQAGVDNPLFYLPQR